MFSNLTDATATPLENAGEISAGNSVAVRVNNLGKCYQIYDSPRQRLKQFVAPRLQRLARQDPKQYFREFWALRSISFEVEKGETLGIIGRNGSGKSTLLQLICGTLSPSTGTVETNGRVAALLELGAGFNPEFTGRENVWMSCALLGLSAEETEAKFDDIAAFADIGNFVEQPVKTYSSGMYVRLAFAVNIVSRPDIMIVDEALAVGDMGFQAKCMTALARTQDRGATILFVSHDIGALKGLCSRGIYLDQGTVQAIGKAPDIAEQYTRTMREEMTTEIITGRLANGVKKRANEPEKQLASCEARNFKVDSLFEGRVAPFRYGDGSAKITYAELLDEDLQPINKVRFNQSVFVRVYFETFIDDEVSCNYYVLDDKRNLILGADVLLVGASLIPSEEGGRYIVTYKTRLPLQEGSYSIQLQITAAAVLGSTARFLDVVDDAMVFAMSRRDGMSIWTKVFVNNEVDIQSC